ncbi:hypothetical protein Geob_2708 [Geotalea daltonii FRC-32]|uniref:TIR domain-containing protein n=1 Tax=Geotalea daltonii (strain DSM 22248 / JCM 15807 / FRC-32) TaxID=316067 RepID=B9M1H6_GEODF|nr:TIR domain-containing protein [Geotalea daltonii]ACM21058.1 hypothetical protein Geob_2708 [Geotalea daltonii FRC-32]
MKVFLSHASSEKKMAKTLRRKLEVAGHEVSTSDSMEQGDDITSAIGKLIERAEAFVIIVSPKGLGNERLMWEWRTVLENSWKEQGRPIFGVLVGNVVPPPFLMGRQLVTISSLDDIDTAAEQLLGRLQGNPIDEMVVEDLKARGREIISHLSSEIQKFEPSPEQLEKQRKRLQEKIHELSAAPASGDLARLNLKLVNVIKTLAEKGLQVDGAIPLMTKSLEIMEQLQNTSPEQRAALRTRIAREMEKAGDFQGALEQACRALQVCVEELDKKGPADTECDDNVPALGSLLERIKETVGEENVRAGRSLVSSLISRAADGKSRGGQQ